MKFLPLIFLICSSFAIAEGNCFLCGNWKEHQDLSLKSYLLMDIPDNLRERVTRNASMMFGNDVIYFDHENLTYVNTMVAKASYKVLSNESNSMTIEMKQITPEVDAGQKIVWNIYFEGNYMLIKKNRASQSFFQYFYRSTEHEYNQALQRISR